jgi:hypothetical protein
MSGEQQGRYIVASADGIAALVARLDLSRFIEAGMVIVKAEVILERIRLTLSWEDVGDEVVVLRRADDLPSFMNAHRVAFSIEGAQVTRPYMVLLKRMALAVADTDIDDLIYTVAGGVPVNTADANDSPINSWLDEHAWCQFMCDHAMERKFYEAFSFEDLASFIVHGDLECKFITPRFRATLPRFFNYAWKIFGESEGGDPITDLKDQDVIHGGEKALADSIELMLSGRRRGGPVIINSTCVPVVIDDDVEKVIEQFAHRCPDGIYHLSPRSEDPMHVMMHYLDDARERALVAGDFQSDSVSLVGFRSGRTHLEIADLIQACSIPLIGTILPKASAKLLERVMKADVLVFRPSVFHVELYDRIFGTCGRRMLFPNPPWGIKGTSEWLMTVAAAVGREAEAQAVVADRVAWCQAELESLRLEAANHEMTFVADPSGPARLLDPKSSTGLAVLPAVAELGYKLRVLSLAEDPAAFRDFKDRIAAWAAENGFTVTVDGFTDDASLADAIAAGHGGAVFSEFFYDYRVSRAGRPQFSARDFEMGYEGAVRTARHLNRLVKMPFYSRYGKDLVGSINWWKL